MKQSIAFGVVGVLLCVLGVMTERYTHECPEQYIEPLPTMFGADGDVVIYCYPQSGAVARHETMSRAGDDK